MADTPKSGTKIAQAPHYVCGTGMIGSDRLIPLTPVDGEPPIMSLGVFKVSPNIQYAGPVPDGDKLRPVDPATGNGDYITAYLVEHDGYEYRVPVENLQAITDAQGNRKVIDRETGLIITGDTGRIGIEVMRFTRTDENRGNYEPRVIDVERRGYKIENQEVVRDPEERACPKLSFQDVPEEGSGQLPKQSFAQLGTKAANQIS